MIDPPSATILGLPIDQLGLAVLEDLLRTEAWSEHNYLLDAKNALSDDAARAISEAVAWLTAQGCIARVPGRDRDNIFVTRLGHEAVEVGRHVTRLPALPFL